MKRILQLSTAYDTATSQGLTKEVPNLINDPNTDINRYALQLAVVKSTKRSPDEVIKLLSQEIQSLAMHRHNSLYYCLQIIDVLLFTPQSFT